MFGIQFMVRHRFKKEANSSTFKEEFLYWCAGHARVELTPTSASIALEPGIRLRHQRKDLAEYAALYGLDINPQSPSFKARVSDNDGADSDEASWSVYRDAAKDDHDSDPTGEDEILADLFWMCGKMRDYDDDGESSLVEHIQQ